MFSKVYERFIHENWTPFVNFFFRIYFSLPKKYSETHVLIRLIENLNKSLDQNTFIGAILMDLSKAFDCIPHDLLITKCTHLDFSTESLKLFYSYLKNRKQSVKINNTHSVFQVFLSGVLQG